MDKVERLRQHRLTGKKRRRKRFELLDRPLVEFVVLYEKGDQRAGVNDDAGLSHRSLRSALDSSTGPLDRAGSRTETSPDRRRSARRFRATDSGAAPAPGGRSSISTHAAVGPAPPDGHRASR